MNFDHIFPLLFFLIYPNPSFYTFLQNFNESHCVRFLNTIFLIIFSPPSLLFPLLLPLVYPHQIFMHFLIIHMRENVAFVFLSLSYFVWQNEQQIHSFSYKSLNFILLYGWIFHSLYIIYIKHFHIYYIYEIYAYIHLYNVIYINMLHFPYPFICLGAFRMVS
jgi:hypothetical protein